MEILMIIVGVLAIIGMIAFLVHLFVIAYNKDQKEQDDRILQLEKRIEEYKKVFVLMKMEVEDKVYHINENINELEYKIQKLERKKKSDKE